MGAFGDESVTGKPVGGDLREGKPTPLLARAVAAADAVAAGGARSRRCARSRRRRGRRHPAGDRRHRRAGRTRAAHLGAHRRGDRRPRRRSSSTATRPAELSRRSPSLTCGRGDVSGGPDVRIVVVGAGLGGLSAAAHLSNRGHHVTVLERDAVPGGRAGVLAEAGFRLDTGPTVADDARRARAPRSPPPVPISPTSCTSTRSTRCTAPCSTTVRRCTSGAAARR